MGIEERIKCSYQVNNENKIYCLLENYCQMKDMEHIKLIKLYDAQFGDSEYYNLPICKLYNILEEKRTNENSKDHN